MSQFDKKTDNLQINSTPETSLEERIKSHLPDNDRLLRGLSSADIASLSDELNVTAGDITHALHQLEQNALADFEQACNRSQVPTFVSPMNVVEKMLGPLEQEQQDITKNTQHPEKHLHQKIDHVHHFRDVPWAADPERELKQEEKEQKMRRLEELDDLIDP